MANQQIRKYENDTIMPVEWPQQRNCLPKGLEIYICHGLDTNKHLNGSRLRGMVLPTTPIPHDTTCMIQHVLGLVTSQPQSWGTLGLNRFIALHLVDLTEAPHTPVQPSSDRHPCVGKDFFSIGPAWTTHCIRFQVHNINKSTFHIASGETGPIDQPSVVPIDV